MPAKFPFRQIRPLDFMALLAAFLIAVIAIPCPAAALTWVGGASNNWSDDGAGGNWQGGAAAPVSGTTITYNSASTGNMATQNIDIAGLTGMNINMSGNPDGDSIILRGHAIGISGTSSIYPSARHSMSFPDAFLSSDAVIAIGEDADLHVGDIDLNGHNLRVHNGDGRFSNYLILASNISGNGSLELSGSEISVWGNLTYSGDTLVSVALLNVWGSFQSDSRVVLDNASLSFYQSGTIGSLSGTGWADVSVGGSLDFGGNNDSTTFSGRFGSDGDLRKSGSGTMTLTGDSTNTSRFDVNGGALVVSGTLRNNPIAVAGGATLRLGAAERLISSTSITLSTGALFDLNGFDETIATLSGSGTVTSGGGTLTITTALSPGASPGSITLGNFNLPAGAALNAELDGVNPGTQYDQVIANGAVTLGGNLNLTSSISPAAGTTFTIINNTAGAVAGTFAGLAEGSTISADGTTYRISYVGGTGNDVVLTALASGGGGGGSTPEPEPDTPPAPPVPQGSGPSPTGSLDGTAFSWPSVKGATHYRIYRADCPLCPRKEIGRTTENSFVDNTAIAGQPYAYWLRSENGDGLGGYSNWMAAWRYEQNPGRAGDFNGDGVMDLLWWNPDDNHLYIWFMMGGQVTNVSAPIDSLDISQWLLIGTGDFNGDGACDLLWWKPETGEILFWYMQPAMATASAPFQAMSDPVSQTMTAHAALSYPGDLNGDGISDILWRDYASGDLTIWLMGADGKPTLSGPPTPADDTITRGERPGVSGGLQWQVAGLKEADGDGKADLIWQDERNNRLVTWFMDGANILRVVEENKGLDTVWRLAGLGDLNMDGQADIVWRNEASGEVKAWLMQAGVFQEERAIVPGSDEATQWQVKAVGDFCSPGCDDVYCRHSETSAAKIVTLGGEEFTPVVE
jgi:autotransporter-associated beta strand protein